jgi:CheY-like chemotaxis protein
MFEDVNDGDSAADRRCRVLLVDDDDDTRELMARLLSRDYDVTAADCFDAALATAEARRPDVVVTDVGLPGKSGAELMRELSARYGVPGIAVTGHAIEDVERPLDAGFVGWLTKPIRLDELLQAVRSACAPKSSATRSIA